jgi:hypothetical protein
MLAQVMPRPGLLATADVVAGELAALPTSAAGDTRPLLRRSFEPDLESSLFEERMAPALLSTAG